MRSEKAYKIQHSVKDIKEIHYLNKQTKIERLLKDKKTATRVRARARRRLQPSGKRSCMQQKHAVAIGRVQKG